MELFNDQRVKFFTILQTGKYKSLDDIKNGFQAEILSYLEKACQLIPDKGLTAECKELVDSYYPIIIGIITGELVSKAQSHHTRPARSNQPALFVAAWALAQQCLQVVRGHGVTNPLI